MTSVAIRKGMDAYQPVLEPNGDLIIAINVLVYPIIAVIKENFQLLLYGVLVHPLLIWS